MKEFELAHHRMVEGDGEYLIAMLLEPLDMNVLPEELQLFLQTYTYIDATKHPRKKILYVLKHFEINHVRLNPPSLKYDKINLTRKVDL